MERLTQRLRTGEVLMASDYEEKYTEQEWICVLQDRLAAYEDTGLEPAMCANYKTFEDEAISKGVTFKRIIALMEADRTGRLVVLPCKVGNVLYRASPSGVVVHRVVNVVYRGLTSRWYIDTIPNLPYASEELGKTTFFTREEAEKALEAMKKEETEHG